MRDEMDGRIWVEHHAAFSASIEDGLKAIGHGWKRLVEVEFSAPWRSGQYSNSKKGDRKMNLLQAKFAGLALAAALASVSATLLAVGSPAAAATPIVVQAAPSTAVRHADLNLSSLAGAERLNDRVRSAAERLCVESGTKPVRKQMDERACLDEAIARAAPQIGLAIATQRGSGVSAGSR